MNNCFSIYHTSWITSGPKSNFIYDNITTKAILFLFGCSEVNSTWLITSELANQRARKVLFTCVVYTNNDYHLFVFISLHSNFHTWRYFVCWRFSIHPCQLYCQKLSTRQVGSFSEVCDKFRKSSSWKNARSLFGCLCGSLSLSVCEEKKLKFTSHKQKVLLKSIHCVLFHFMIIKLIIIFSPCWYPLVKTKERSGNTPATQKRFP